jgi:NADPH-dependent curcumin reductase CurA
MRDPKIQTQSYSSAMEIGQPIVSISVIGKVLKSDNSKFKEGSLVFLFLSGTESYSIVPESKLGTARVIELENGIPLTAHLGALGMTGMDI